MLPKTQKIPRVVFPDHRMKKTVWNGGVIHIQCFSGNTNSPRFAVVVAKKKYSTTVQRNLFKRRVFSVLRGLLSEQQLYRFGSYVIVPSMRVDDISYSEIKTDIATFFRDRV